MSQALSSTLFCYLIFIIFVTRCHGSTRYITHVQNYVKLVAAYSQDGYVTQDFPPLEDVSSTMLVNLDMSLFAINGFDEVAGNIELVAAMNMTWIDEMPTIHSISFNPGELESFLVPYDMIWTPKIVLTNAVGEASVVGDIAYLCRFNMLTNRVTWKPRVVINAACTPDVTYYPFDKQKCDFIYTAWGFLANELELTTETNEWDMAEYGESGEWDIAETSTEPFELNGQSYINFKLTIVRKPLYFAFNIILPVLVLCLLNSTVFLLPAESGERVGFSVTCFLSFVVLLNMIMDIMPRSSSPISFLCFYLVVMMANSGAMTLVTILMMRVYFKPEKSKVPRFIQRTVTFLNCGCAKLRCCVLCCRAIRSQCSCNDKRYCGCKSKKVTASEQSLSSVSDNSETEIESSHSKCFPNCFVSCKKRDNDDENGQGCVIEDETQKSVKDKKQNNGNKSSSSMSGSTDELLKEKESAKCFSFLNKGKIIKLSTTESADNDNIESQLYATSSGRFANDMGANKKKFTGPEEQERGATILDNWVNADEDTLGKKASTLSSIQLESKDGTDQLKKEDEKNITADTSSEKKKSKWDNLKPNKKGDKLLKELEKTKNNNKVIEKENASKNVNNKDTEKNHETKVKEREPLPKPEVFPDSNIELPQNISKNKDSVKKSKADPTIEKPVKVVDVEPVDDDEDDVDSLAELEEEVEWAEVGRILDTVFFLTFSGGQAFFTVVFLVPIFTN